LELQSNGDCRNEGALRVLPAKVFRTVIQKHGLTVGKQRYHHEPESRSRNGLLSHNLKQVHDAKGLNHLLG